MTRKHPHRTVNHSDPYARTTLQGRVVDNRTKSAFEWVNKRFHAKTGKWLTVVQGSYNAGKVRASGGTHDGGGALDVSVIGLTSREIHLAVRLFRRAGFCMWFRHTIPGLWTQHIHGILDRHRTASYGAKQQMGAYHSHRDGLVSNAHDSTWRPKRARVWSHRQDRPVYI